MGNKAFGKKLNYIRKKRKLTSEQLGELCDVNAGYIRQIESGRRVPSFNLFIDLCNALNISSDYLLEQEINITNNDDEDIYAEVFQSEHPLVGNETPAVVLKINDYCIEISNHAAPNTILNTLSVLQQLC